jgi:twitching motility protein PilT
VTRLAQFVAKLDTVGASELLLGPSRPPLYRSASGLLPLPGEAAVGTGELQSWIEAWLGPDRWAHLHSRRAISCVLGVPSHPRLRVRCTLGRLGPTLQARVLDAPLALEELQLPAALAGLGDLTSGLVIITGPAGSGKTNALASLVQVIAERRRRHIVTLENPVELLHHSRISSVSQREIGSHCSSFAIGVRSALQANADVIVMAKPTDDELCEVALRAAHSALVLAEVPGRGCVSVLERLLAASSALSDSASLADAFAAVVALELLPKRGGGRVPACEIITHSQALGVVLRDGKPGAIMKLPEPAYGPGSQTFEASKLELLRQGLVDAKN